MVKVSFSSVLFLLALSVKGIHAFEGQLQTAGGLLSQGNSPQIEQASDTCSDNGTCETTGMLSQTTGSSISAETGVACGFYYPDDDEDDVLIQGTKPTTWARCFVFEDEGCTTTRRVDSISFGAEVVEPNNPVSLIVKLYRDCGCLEGQPGSSSVELVRSISTTLNPATQGNQIISINVGAPAVAFAPHEAIRVEIEQVSDGQGYSEESPLRFFPASTNAGASAPTYLKSTACGITSLTTVAALGFPNSHMIIDLSTSPTTQEPSPLVCCSAGSCENNDLEECDETMGTCILKEECRDPPQDSCDFYEDCLEEAFACGTDGYPLKFGKTMCNVFLENDRGSGFLELSAGGKAWSRDVRQCLKEVLVPVIEDRECYTCSSVRTFAFESHVPCYLDTGFCERLAPADYVKLSVLVSEAISFDSAGDIYDQVIATVKECGPVLLDRSVAAVELVFAESLSELLETVFDGSLSALKSYLRGKFEKVLEDLFPGTPIPYAIWDVIEGSTQVTVLLSSDDDAPEHVATEFVTVIESSNSSGLNLTFNSSEVCVGEDCAEMLGIEIPEQEDHHCFLFCFLCK